MKSKVNDKYKQKIGILGGSFNPAHYGHLGLANAILKKLSLNQIWLEVSPQNPHKNSTNNFEQRFNSVFEICKNNPKISASKRESQLMKNSKNFYTANFLARLQKKYPNTQFYWLMGADNLANFHKWYKWQQICKNIKIIVYPRAGYTQKALKSKAFAQFPDTFIILHGKNFDISSTEIRNKNH